MAAERHKCEPGRANTSLSRDISTERPCIDWSGHLSGWSATQKQWYGREFIGVTSHSPVTRPNHH
jgi:hypothetical protein